MPDLHVQLLDMATAQLHFCKCTSVKLSAQVACVPYASRREVARRNASSASACIRNSSAEPTAAEVIEAKRRANTHCEPSRVIFQEMAEQEINLL